MTYSSLTGHTAIAWGARLALVNYISGFTTKPALSIIETLSDWISQGEMDGTVSMLENEAAIYTAAANAAGEGQRVFALTSGQYLMMAFNLIHAASNWRIPMVLFNLVVNDQDNTTTIPDHDSALAARDSGFIQLYCASCQEIVDSMLLAYRLSEDEAVRLPVLINLDHQSLCVAQEEVDIPNRTAARQFIGSCLQPVSEPAIMTLESRRYAAKARTQPGYRYSMHLALQQALAIYDELADEFRDFFGRHYPAIEAHACDDADFMFILTGACLHHANEAITRLRETGWKIGVLRPRLLRPFPHHSLIRLLRGKQAVAVIDTHLSPGKGGVLHSEIVSALYGQHDATPIVASFVVGQGNQDISVKQFLDIAVTLREAAETGATPYPRVLTA